VVDHLVTNVFNRGVVLCARASVRLGFTSRLGFTRSPSPRARVTYRHAKRPFRRRLSPVDPFHDDGKLVVIGVILRKVVHVVRLSLGRRERAGGSLGGSLSTSLCTREKSLFVSPSHLFTPTSPIVNRQTPRRVPRIPRDPRRISSSLKFRLVVARLSWNSNRTLTLAFALDAAAHRTKHTRNTPASVSRCAFSSRQSLRRFTRASIRIATPRTTNEPSDGALGVDVHDVASFTSTASSSRVVIEVIIDRDAPALRTRRSARRLGRRRLSLRRAHHRSLRSLRRNTD